MRRFGIYWRATLKRAATGSGKCLMSDGFGQEGENLPAYHLKPRLRGLASRCQILAFGSSQRGIAEKFL
ncbi:hypothetical protein MESS4_640142 [Mesorhizobium sp. STM 4661]|nr:hypothetical protein MESS4_640142 [Mesorhizobium sp. STM 4661]